MLNNHKLIQNQTVTKAALACAVSHKGTAALNIQCMHFTLHIPRL